LDLELDRFAEILEEAHSFSLVGVDRHGCLSSHTIVAEFYRQAATERSGYLSCVNVLADEAKTYVESLEKYTPLHAEALLAMFRLFGYSFRFLESFQVRPALRGTLVFVARQLYRDKRYDQALEYLGEASRLPRDGLDDFDVEILTAQCMSGVGELESARQVLAALPESEEDSHLLRVRGRVEANASNWLGAFEYFDRSVRASRRPYAALLRDRGQARLELADCRGAEGDLEAAISLDPADGFSYYYLSRVYGCLNQIVSARSAISKAMELYPSSRVFRSWARRVS